MKYNKRRALRERKPRPRQL